MSNGVVSQFILDSRKLPRKLAIAVAVTACWGAPQAKAADLTWGGFYRFEAVKVNNAELTSDKTDKTYGLHHLVLLPKLVAADGLTIHSRLDILNDPTHGINGNGQIYSVAGDVLGNGPGTPVSGATGPVTGTDSNAWGRTMRAGTLAITELWASWTQEFGQLIVGRAPIHFGLGTAFNSGQGLFDHYIDTRDMVSYKVVLGNFSVTPMFGKMSEGGTAVEDDVDDYILHLQYDNPDSELSLGFIYNLRVVLGNDSPVPTSSTYWPAGFTRSGSYKNTLMGFYLSEKALPWLRASVEADLLSGDSGVVNAGGAGLGLNSFGFAGEVATIPSAEDRWSGVFKFGMATGDDPGTNDAYEGYAFSRNYDVALLMFNHPLGKADFLRTGMIRNASQTASSQIDTEAISNTIYFAPSVKYRAKDNLTWGATFVYALLNKDPLLAGSGSGGAGTATDLGYELDLSVNYKPLERLTWITEAGFLLPGNAWKGGSNSYENKFAYGVVTKAAISF